MIIITCFESFPEKNFQSMDNAFDTRITDTGNRGIITVFDGSTDPNYVFHPAQTQGCMK